MSFSEFFSCADQLEHYSFIRIEKNKKEIKQSYTALTVELNKLLSELDKLDNRAGGEEWGIQAFLDIICNQLSSIP